MPSLTHQRCFNHFQREAVARCVECRQFFCRECVTEHDDRILCASCLKKLLQPALTSRRWFVGILRLAQGLAGVLLLWLVFYLLGVTLLDIPTSFHEGTLWRLNWYDRE